MVLDTSPYSTYIVSDAALSIVVEEVVDQVDDSESAEGDREQNIAKIVEEVIKDCERCQNPTEVLLCAQDKIFTGKQLDITDPTTENNWRCKFHSS